MFSANKDRIDYMEYRETVLRLDPEEHYTPDCSENGNDTERVVRAVIPALWKEVPGANLRYHKPARPMLFQVPSDNTGVSVPLSDEGWQRCAEILSCQLPVSANNELYEKCVRSDGVPLQINLSKSKKVFSQLAFATARLDIPNAVRDDWQTMLDPQGKYDDMSVPCRVCSPEKPSVVWTAVSRGRSEQFVPIEEGRQAALYERAVKRRPNPWEVRLQLGDTIGDRKNDTTLRLNIGCNAFSLVQRAFGLFPSDSFTLKLFLFETKTKKKNKTKTKSRECSPQTQFDWRIVTHVDKSSLAVNSGNFPKLTFTSNRKDKPALQPPGFQKPYRLRPEQLRSLAWMLRQEERIDPFYEEEVTEAVLPSLNWRAEGRVRRPVLVRGGIVADEVCV